MMYERIIDCDMCQRPVLVCISDFSRQEIRIYPFVNSSNVSVAPNKIVITKKQSEEKNNFDYEVICPICENIIFAYSNVPKNYNFNIPDVFLLSVSKEDLEIEK